MHEEYFCFAFEVPPDKQVWNHWMTARRPTRTERDHLDAGLVEKWQDGPCHTSLIPATGRSVVFKTTV